MTAFRRGYLEAIHARKEWRSTEERVQIECWSGLRIGILRGQNVEVVTRRPRTLEGNEEPGTGLAGTPELSKNRQAAI